MLRIRYSSGDDVDIEGSAHDLLTIRQAVEELVKTGHESVTVSTAVDFDPAPYERTLRHLQLRISDRNIALVTDDCLIVSGNVDFLESFARDLPWDAKQPESGVQYHVHLDRLSYGPEVDESSIGMILSLRREADGPLIQDVFEDFHHSG
ncbi:MAG: hypothetical protein KDA96_10710 [Planctomycetaceae bacterium]|nr:hypothetical protein [Planctomycetaceae bacterium]